MRRSLAALPPGLHAGEVSDGRIVARPFSASGCSPPSSPGTRIRRSRPFRLGARAVRQAPHGRPQLISASPSRRPSYFPFPFTRRPASRPASGWSIHGYRRREMTIRSESATLAHPTLPPSLEHPLHMHIEIRSQQGKGRQRKYSILVAFHLPTPPPLYLSSKKKQARCRQEPFSALDQARKQQRHPGEPASRDPRWPSPLAGPRPRREPSPVRSSSGSRRGGERLSIYINNNHLRARLLHQGQAPQASSMPREACPRYDARGVEHRPSYALPAARTLTIHSFSRPATVFCIPCANTLSTSSRLCAAKSEPSRSRRRATAARTSTESPSKT